MKTESSQSSPVETPVRSAEEILQKHRAKDDSLPHWVTNKHAIEAMKEYASQFKPSVVREKEEQGWISVDERLPEPQYDCLFTNVNLKGFKTPPVSSGYYTNDRFYSWGGNLEGLKATHWMPLPTPPKV